MADTYTFTKDEKGRALRTTVAAGHRAAGRSVREYEETVNFAIGTLDLSFPTLKLEVSGKRHGEGQIAADMKGLRRKPL